MCGDCYMRFGAYRIVLRKTSGNFVSSISIGVFLWCTKTNEHLPDLSYITEKDHVKGNDEKKRRKLRSLGHVMMMWEWTQYVFGILIKWL